MLVLLLIIAFFVEHNSIAMQHYPSEYDPLHVEGSYSTPKLVVENNIIRSQTPPPSKADDVICERPLLPKLSTKTKSKTGRKKFSFKKWW